MDIEPIERFFSPDSSSRAAAPRVQTASGNYLASVRKPTAVTQSCFGNFTGPYDQNLIICKGTLVSIYLKVEDELQHLRDFPMYDRVVFMELSRVGLQHRLLIATELDIFYMFKWDTKDSNVISVKTMMFTPKVAQHGIGDQAYQYIEFLQGATVSPDGKRVVMYHKRNQLRVIGVHNTASALFRKRLPGANILDVKFLKKHVQPRLALLFMGNDGLFHSGIYNITANNILPSRVFALQPDHAVIEPTFLVPNPESFLIIGKEGVIFFDDHDTEVNLMGYIDIHTFGKVTENPRCSSYLLGGCDGQISVIEIEKDSMLRFSRLTLRSLGKFPVASSITYLSDGVVFVGSRFADSQLVRMHQLHNSQLKTPAVEVLKIFTNSGPIIDFSLRNKPAGVRKLVMCCGSHEDSSLESVTHGVGIIEKMDAKISHVTRIWSLKPTTGHRSHTFLILLQQLGPVTGHTRVLRADDQTGDISPHMMPGLLAETVTVCCQEVGEEDFIQVTEHSIRLIDLSDGLLRYQWLAKSKILFASATPTQVLVATLDQELIYLQIRGRTVIEENTMKGCDVSCLDISILSPYHYQSRLAAVGQWQTMCVMLLSLPNLVVLTVKQVSRAPRCVLLCGFEKEFYLLCALNDGTLSTFTISKDNRELQEKESKKLGGGLVTTLRAFSAKGVARVFLSSLDKEPHIIFSKKQVLQYSIVNLLDIRDMCPFHRPDNPEGLAMVKGNGVVFCKLGDIEENLKLPMINYGRRICQQEEGESNVVLVEEKRRPAEDFRRHLVQLLDEDLNTLSSFRLNERELGLSVVGCSFAGDEDNAFYCVGTSTHVAGGHPQGRILVLQVRDRTLDLVSQTLTNGPVKYLKALHGGLLGIVSEPEDIPHYFEWQLHGNAHELHENPELVGNDAGGVEERVASISASIQRYESHGIAIDIEPRLRTNLTAIQMLQDGSFLYTDLLYNIRSSDGFVGEMPREVGKWYSGEFVTQLKAGSLARLPDEDNAQVPGAVFSTVSGAIGVIVSLPSEVFEFMKKLEFSIRKRTWGKGCPLLQNPFEAVGLSSTSRRSEIIDGDLIESFPTLALRDQQEIVSELKVELRVLEGLVAFVTRFH